jgi:low temperature requirement protein LtrA
MIHLSVHIQEEFASAGFFEVTVMPMTVWLAWAVSYYIVVRGDVR